MWANNADPDQTALKGQFAIPFTSFGAQLISAFIFNTYILQSLYYLNQKFQASSHPSSMAVQPDLCWTWSETPQTGFHATQLIYVYSPMTTLILDELRPFAQDFFCGLTYRFLTNTRRSTLNLSSDRI